MNKDGGFEKFSTRTKAAETRFYRYRNKQSDWFLADTCQLQHNFSRVYQYVIVTVV